MRAPFAAGPYKDSATGALLGDANKWTMQLELSEAKQQILQKELIDPMIEWAKAHAQVAFPPQTRMRGGKEEVTKPGFSPDDIEKNSESPIKEPKEERWRPTLRVNVNANPDEPNRHPNVQVAEFRDTSISKRQPGSLATLQQANCVGTWFLRWCAASGSTAAPASAAFRSVSRATSTCPTCRARRARRPSSTSSRRTKTSRARRRRRSRAAARAVGRRGGRGRQRARRYDAGGLAAEGMPEDADA